jgi:hypothetical protein
VPNIPQPHCWFVQSLKNFCLHGACWRWVADNAMENIAWLQWRIYNLNLRINMQPNRWIHGTPSSGPSWGPNRAAARSPQDKNSVFGPLNLRFIYKYRPILIERPGLVGLSRPASRHPHAPKTSVLKISQSSLYFKRLPAGSKECPRIVPPCYLSALVFIPGE